MVLHVDLEQNLLACNLYLRLNVDILGQPAAFNLLGDQFKVDQSISDGLPQLLVVRNAAGRLLLDHRFDAGAGYGLARLAAAGTGSTGAWDAAGLGAWASTGAEIAMASSNAGIRGRWVVIGSPFLPLANSVKS
jgi:hypothetical protein